MKHSQLVCVCVRMYSIWLSSIAKWLSIEVVSPFSVSPSSVTFPLLQIHSHPQFLHGLDLHRSKYVYIVQTVIRTCNIQLGQSQQSIYICMYICTFNIQLGQSERMMQTCRLTSTVYRETHLHHEPYMPIGM